MQVYADNAATEKIRPAALNKYLEVATEFFGNPSSLHEEGQRAKEELERCRETFARILNCAPKEIIFTSGGSESDNQAIFGAAAFGAKKGKRKIVASAIEHHAVLHPLEKLKKEGFEVVLLPVDERGIVSLAAAEKEIDGDTCLVSVMFANNEIGSLQPVKEIAALCKARGALFHTDAVQAVGHMPVDVKESGCDYLSLSAHKFGGARGMGALYARSGAPLSAYISGGAQERNKRAGTENLPAIAASAVALEEAVKEMDEERAHVRALRDYVIAELKKIPHSALNGDEKLRLDGNVSFCFEGIEGESLLLLLSEKGIAASSGSACTSGSLDPSHVLLAIGRVHDVAHGSLRLTFNRENTQAEAEYLVRAVTETVEYLRSISPVWRDLQQGKRNYIL